MMSVFDVALHHAAMWDKLTGLRQSHHISPAWLWIGPQHLDLTSLALRFMASMLCFEDNAPCGSCNNCVLFKEGVYPDLYTIGLVAPSSVIKIDQVRALHAVIHQRPQRGGYRLVLIDPADKLNDAAVNALLKILEEPPSQTLFLLIAEQRNALPETLISRCQCEVFADSSHVTVTGAREYTALGAYYAPEHVRAQIYTQRPELILGLGQMLDGVLTPSEVAVAWSAHEWDAQLWFLYLITAQAIHDGLLGQVGNDVVMRRMASLPTWRLFSQLGQITTFMQKRQDAYQLNTVLALERVLLGFLEENHVD